MEIEPAPLIENPEIKHSFETIKNAKTLDLLRNGYFQGITDTTLLKNILWLNDIQANNIINKFEAFQNISNLFKTFPTQ